MPELTIVIPVAPYHSHLAQNAIDSVLAQTVPCNVLTVDDKDGRGAAWSRNQGLRQVNSEFVAFLDADDTIEPDFAEKCFLILNEVRGNRYVYTNWYEGDKIIVAPSPCEVWTQQTYHLVTTVMHTADVRRLGGYDENMPGAEDTDFGIRLKIAGICGVHLNAPLLHYRPGGQRSKQLRASGQEAHMLQYMKERYKEYTMGCCAENVPVDDSPQGERHDGDVMAMSLWNGNDRRRGLATGRVYPRTGNGKVVWVDPLDVQAAPHHWRKVSAMPVANPALQPGYQAQPVNWRGAGDIAFGGGSQPVQPQGGQGVDWEYKPVENGRSLNDKLKLGQKKSE